VNENLLQSSSYRVNAVSDVIVGWSQSRIAPRQAIAITSINKVIQYEHKFSIVMHIKAFVA